MIEGPENQLDAARFLSIVRNRFECRSSDVESYYENRLQLEIASSLLDSGFKTFTEYPYEMDQGRSARCDIVVTIDSNVQAVTHWIEIKPLWIMSNYWSPSKFFGRDAPFREDVRKLATRPSSGARWLLVVAFTLDEAVALQGESTTILPRARLTLPQMCSAITQWGRVENMSCDSIRATNCFCHLLLWSIEGFSDFDFLNSA